MNVAFFGAVNRISMTFDEPHRSKTCAVNSSLLATSDADNLCQAIGTFLLQD